MSSYQFNDINPFTQFNTIFYRLKTVDQNASYAYSNIVSVSHKVTVLKSLTVYPNPFNADLTVEIVADQETAASVSIFDITGRVVMENTLSQLVKGNNLLKLDAGDLQKGIYFISVGLNNEKQVIKMVKQ